MLAIENNWNYFITGSTTAFLNIYKENYNLLFAYGYSITGDKEITKDCLQEMFLELWKTRSSANKDVENVRSYLCTWLRRKITRTLSRIRKEKSCETSAAGFEPHQVSYEDLIITLQESAEKKEKITQALSHLTKKQLEIIRLKFFENLSYGEISTNTGLSTRTIYNQIYLAIQTLREEFKLVHAFNLTLLMLSFYICLK